MKKIRINVLARELEVKSHLILELLPDLGVSEKLTHSSSIDDDVADKLRVRFGIEPVGSGNGQSTAQTEAEEHGGVAVEEPPAQTERQESAQPTPAPASVEPAPQQAKPEAAPEPPVTEQPIRAAPPIRPPISAPGQ